MMQIKLLLKGHDKRRNKWVTKRFCHWFALLVQNQPHSNNKFSWSLKTRACKLVLIFNTESAEFMVESGMGIRLA